MQMLAVAVFGIRWPHTLDPAEDTWL
jgi:hypothetical protein